MRAPLWLAFALIPVAHSADPGEVSIRSGAWSPRPPAISANSNLVESAVTVYDSQGRPTGGLKAADFVMSDNGKPQPITFFSELRNPVASTGSSSDTNLPPASHQTRSVALFFDDLHLSTEGLQRSKRAAENLIASGLQPGERMGIFTDSGTVTVDFTSDAATLLAALPRIKSHTDPADLVTTICPSLTPYTAFLIAQHLELQVRERAVAEVMSTRCDGVSHTIAEGKVQDYAESLWENSRHRSTSALDVLKVVVAHLAKQNGSRILILLSEGFVDDDRMRSQKSAIFDDALRSRVVINSLATQGLSQEGLSYRQLILTNTMADAAAATGGWLIRNNNDLNGALNGLASTPEESYLVGFQAGDPDGKYHTLKLRLFGHNGYKVESRPGYFAAVPVRKPDTVQQRIDNAVLSDISIQDVPASVRIVPTGQKFQVRVDIDAKRLKFAAANGSN